jgi:hypothetical protein
MTIDPHYMARVTAKHVERARNLIPKLHNLYGPVGPRTRGRLYAVLEDPTNKTWNNSYSIILAPKALGLTLWQAIIEIDGGFIQVGPSYKTGENWNSRPWKQIPSQAHIIMAIANVAHMHYGIESAGELYTEIWNRVYEASERDDPTPGESDHGYYDPSQV